LNLNNFETISVKVAEQVGWITMSRPEVRNAFDERMI